MFREQRGAKLGSKRRIQALPTNISAGFSFFLEVSISSFALLFGSLFFLLGVMDLAHSLLKAL